AIYDGAEDHPHPVAATLRPTFVDGIDDAGAETILDALHASTAPMKAVQFRALGGAVARVGRDATAFPHRSRRALLTVAAMYESPAESEVHDAWADQLADRLRQGEPGAYIGFLTDVRPERLGGAYPADTWARLQAI